MNSPSTTPADLSTRWHGLDAVRAFALLLGVVLHASMSFLPGAQYFWVAADSSQSVVAAAIFYVRRIQVGSAILIKIWSVVRCGTIATS